MKAASKDVQTEVTDKHERSGYRADVHPVLVSYFAQEGLTDAQIASRLRISRRTLYSWRIRHPELAAALKDSKELADALVEHSLFQKALSGDVSACIFYLCNRSPARWKRNGQVDAQMATMLPTEVMSLEEIMRTYSGAGRQVAGGRTRLHTIKGMQSGAGDAPGKMMPMQQEASLH